MDGENHIHENPLNSDNEEGDARATNHTPGKKIAKKAAKFFKVHPMRSNEEEDREKLLWDDRRRRMLGRVCSKKKCKQPDRHSHPPPMEGEVSTRIAPSSEGRDVCDSVVEVQLGDLSIQSALTQSIPVDDRKSKLVEIPFGEHLYCSDGVRGHAAKVALTGAIKAVNGFKKNMKKETAEDDVAVEMGPVPVKEMMGVRPGNICLVRSGSRTSSPPGDTHDGLLDAAKETFEPLPGKNYDFYTDHRPFFTYYMAFSQTLILIISIMSYGFGPWGFTTQKHTANVLVPSMYLQQVDFSEVENPWLGPSPAALIHLGAKFTPCLRRDKNIWKEIVSERMAEANTGCCIRNDESGCGQTSEGRCSSLLSTWHKWTDKTGPLFERIDPLTKEIVKANRTSGAVCGQDPRYCENPASKAPYEWPDDISRWPVCQETSRPHLAEPHMSCEVVSRPCCIGVYGECRLTTVEYCSFVNGHFHEEASLCSQVSCMGDVCGLIPFLDPERPDQFYRLFIALFLHAGIIHLLCTLVWYYFFMSHLEQMLGPMRTCFIYFGSGIAGNLMSASFVPYRAEVGPAGSIMGMEAALIAVFIYSWEELKEEGLDPRKELARHILLITTFFLCGLLMPWIDNYAHIGGFLVGFVLSLVLVPFVVLSSFTPDRKKTFIWIGLVLVVTFNVILIILLYYYPIYDCSWCKYLNCFISLFDSNLCPDQAIKITRVGDLL